MRCGSPPTRSGSSVTLPADFSEQIVAAQEKQFLMVRVPFVVETVSSGTPAADAKLQRRQYYWRKW